MFKDIIKDLYPGKELKISEFKKLKKGIVAVAKTKNYILNDNFYEKII